MKRILFLLIALSQLAVCQWGLRTVMEVEYSNSDYGLGGGILGLGDINNDGKPDFAVSAGNILKTFIYFGGKGVLDITPDVVIKGGGRMVKGDFNGDGRMDLAVQGWDTIYVYYGRVPTPIGIDTTADLILTGEKLSDGFGYSFTAGDLNADGYDDLFVSSALAAQAAGKVYAYMGKPMPSAVPDFVIVGDTVESFLGTRLSAADINGDGVTDLAISSDARRRSPTIDIFYGHSGWKLTRDGQDQRLDARDGGYIYLQWFSLVDVNADGKADIFFPSADGAYFIFGRSDSIRHIPDLILPNPNPMIYSSFTGYGFPIGDVNMDGKPDYALIAGGGGPARCILVYLGNTRPELTNVAGRCKGFVSSDAFSYIAPLGDVDGDGSNDFGAGAPCDALGSSYPPQNGYFVILGGDSTFKTTSVGNIAVPPRQSKLSQNYPNPFNPRTTIEYAVPKRSQVVLSIFDVSGREIQTLVNVNQTEGHHKIFWDGTTSSGEHAAAGVYYYRLLLDGIQQETKKIVLLR